MSIPIVDDTGGHDAESRGARDSAALTNTAAMEDGGMTLSPLPSPLSLGSPKQLTPLATSSPTETGSLRPIRSASYVAHCEAEDSNDLDKRA